jgi:hypothetical protein
MVVPMMRCSQPYLSRMQNDVSGIPLCGMCRHVSRLPFADHIFPLISPQEVIFDEQSAFISLLDSYFVLNCLRLRSSHPHWLSMAGCDQ